MGGSAAAQDVVVAEQVKQIARFFRTQVREVRFGRSGGKFLLVAFALVVVGRCVLLFLALFGVAVLGIAVFGGGIGIDLARGIVLVVALLDRKSVV